jgi:hypothetical protein
LAYFTPADGGDVFLRNVAVITSNSLHVYGLFNDAFGIQDCTERDGRMVHALEGVVAYFNVLSRHPSAGAQLATLFFLFLLDLRFNREDGSDIFLRNIGLSRNYPALQIRRVFS